MEVAIYNSMNTLDFKHWLEMDDMMNAEKDIQTDPNLSQAAKKAQIAATDAVNKGKNPIKAAQRAVINAKVPPNKMGQVMPQNVMADNQ